MVEQTAKAIAAMRQAHDEMVTFSEGADPKALDAPSGASEWTVADVLSHLGSAAEIGLHTLVAGKADLDAAPAIWDRWNAMSAAEKATNFVSAGERLVAAYEALSDDELAGKRVDVGFLPEPVDVAFLAAMRLSEVGLHGWDVDVAFDPAATVRDCVVPFVLAKLPVFAGFFAKPIGKTGHIAASTTDPVGEYVIEVREDGASLREGADAGAGTTLTIPGEALVRLTGGRLGPDHTPTGVSARGELGLDDLRKLFPGY
jgi:uncharacterized protein (TIGR03083 family)